MIHAWLAHYGGGEHIVVMAFGATHTHNIHAGGQSSGANSNSNSNSPHLATNLDLVHVVRIIYLLFLL